MKNKKTFLLNKTKTRKVGKTTFVVSSFFKADGSVTFIKILKRLIETELSA